MLNIDSADKRISDIEEIKKICKQNGSPVMMLGVTHTSERIATYLKNHGVDAQIRFVLDDEYFNSESQSKGVIPFSKYLEEYSATSPLVFGFFDYRIILKKKEQYWDRIPYMFDFHITEVNGELVDWSPEYVAERIGDYEKTYNLLSSEKDRNAMETFLNAAVCGKFDTLFRNYRDEIPYFNEKLSSVSIDRLFDCGAFDGDSAHDFVAVFNDYEHIYEFEPDPLNVEKIKARVKNESIRDLSIVQKGVWSETTTLRFASEGKSSSNVSDEGDIAIDVMRLDDMYAEFTHKSLIKMDIEGSELAALKGAARVISEISPALAICVYHKRDDLITIPQYIDSLVKPGTYNYYVGYQGLDLAEFVFYAVPKDI